MAKRKESPHSHFDGPERRPRKVKKTSWQPGRCPVCGASIKMVPFEELEKHFKQRPSNSKKVFDHPDYYWCCSNYPACDTYVSAEINTKRPYGTLAGPSLRYKRILVHQWCTAFIASGKHTPVSFWSMCGYHVGIDNHDAVHARDMTEMQCDTILAYCKLLAEHDPALMSMVHPLSKPGQLLGLKMPDSSGPETEIKG